MIRKLKDLVPTTEKEIDRHYYYCYGEGSVQVEKTGDVVVYIIRGERFGDYLHNAYGKSVKVPSLQRDVHLHRVDVFGPAYTNKYGYPFVNTSHHHGNDFSCLNPSAAHKGYGQVERIEGSTVYVNAHDGERTQLHIGSCSRVEAVTQVPKVGQSIYYSGVPSSAGGYNLYTATCV